MSTTIKNESLYVPDVEKRMVYLIEIQMLDLMLTQ